MIGSCDLNGGNEDTQKHLLNFQSKTVFVLSLSVSEKEAAVHVVEARVIVTMHYIYYLIFCNRTLEWFHLILFNLCSAVIAFFF